MHRLSLALEAAVSPAEHEDVRFNQDFKIRELEVDRGAVVLLEGSNSPQLYTVLSGMGLRHKTLPDGRRQVLNFVFPGDFLGLQAGIMAEMKHSVEASTRMTLCVFDRKSIWRLFQDHPSRAFDLAWITSVTEHMLGEALATVGQKNAESRIAWALVKVFDTCAALEMTRGNVCPMPFRQQDLADALGLSLVHTNKSLASFRRRQLASWHSRQLHLTDREALAEIGSSTAPKESRAPCSERARSLGELCPHDRCTVRPKTTG